MNVRFRVRALADIDDIRQYLEKRSPGGALNVVQAIHASIRSIADQPMARNVQMIRTFA